MKVDNFRFDFVSEIKPEKNKQGLIKLYMPQQRYDRANKEYVHRYGWGPFCKFKIPSENQNQKCVYILKVEDQIKYIGECKNLTRRFNSGYGNISPRNCFKGGQRTNCRINHQILKTKRKNKKIELYIHETTERKKLEKELIQKTKPEWNKENNNTKTRFSQKTQKTQKNKIKDSGKKYTGKYSPLFNYLKNSDKMVINLSFEELEDILEFELPSSARKHRAWWSNGGHSQCEAWMNAEYEVKEIDQNKKYVVFQKNKK